jgi:lipid-A-disaccharide synthase
LINNNSKIFICATEQSGDNIGAKIIYNLLKIDNSIIFDGVGGDKMSPFLNSQYYSLRDFKSLGIIEILFSLKKYISMISFLNKKIIKNNYDLIITIDSPDFNYPLVKRIKKMNKKIKIVQIVAPSVWAWRKNRASKFSKVFDELLVLFKFEIQYFEKYGLKTTFIGHPIYYIDSQINKRSCEKNNLIAFLPGSRVGELDKLFKYFDLAYLFLLEKFPTTKIFIPTLPHLKTNIENLVKDWKIRPIITDDLTEIEKFYLDTSKALVCSGTASLEISKRNIPQLVIYKLNYFTEKILKIFVNVKYATLLNIFENKEIINELVNSDLNSEKFIIEFNKLMNNNFLNDKQIKDVNIALKKILTKEPPYILASKRISSYL